MLVQEIIKRDLIIDSWKYVMREKMQNKKKLATPWGLYCGVCGVYIAHRDDNIKFKDRLAAVYGVAVDDVKCEGLSL